jgi:hypothetical protein
LETRWRGLVILDYELDFPSAPIEVLDLYSAGAARFTTAVLGESLPWGRVRRPGVIEFSAARYDGAIDAFASACRSPSFVMSLEGRLGLLIARVKGELLSAEEGGGGPLNDSLLDPLRSLMAFHVLNWVIPLSQLLEDLADLLGDPEAAQQVLHASLTPLTGSHLMDREVRRPTEAARRAEVSAIAHASRMNAFVVKELVRVVGRSSDVQRVFAYLRLCHIACEEEEERRRVQLRFERLVQRQNSSRSTRPPHDTPTRDALGATGIGYPSAWGWNCAAGT